MAVGLSGVMFALHLVALGLNVWLIGLSISAGLAGCAIGTVAVTYLTDRVGRRTTLIVLAWLMALGGCAMAWATHPSAILVSACLGMVNGMGRDRGAGPTVDQVILPQTATAATRTKVFAWYNLIMDAAHALGALLGSVPAFLRAHLSVPALASYQWTWGLYSGLCLLAGLLALRLSRSVESRNSARRAPRLSAAARPVVTRFALLSGLDSLGGGFLTTALLGYWFFRRFGVEESFLGPLFFVVRVANGLSHLAAAWIATRIGLVNTMVFTHLPSSLLLLVLPVVPTLPMAVAVFLARESLVEMDVPTRQSYLVAVVDEQDRTRAVGVTNLTRSLAWAVAPVVSGSLMSSLSVSAPLVIGAGMKMAYDLLLYRAFRHLKPPEER